MNDTIVPYEPARRSGWWICRHVTLAVQPGRLEMFIPPLRRLSLIDGLSLIRKQYQHAEPLSGLFLWGSQALIWSLAGGLIIPALIDVPGHWQVLGWAGGWGITGAALIHEGLKSLFSKEYVCLADGQLSLGTFFANSPRVTSYPVTQILNLRRATDDCVPEGQLCFTYCGTTIAFGYSLTNAEADRLLTSLLHVLNVPYHHIDRVIFGSHPMRGERNALVRSLCDPDAQLLSYPLVNLSEICIYPAKAEAYRIERFLTYALNALGTKYLKKHVSVNVYGRPEELHPNIRNNLTHLCKQVNFFNEDASAI